MRTTNTWVAAILVVCGLCVASLGAAQPVAYLTSDTTWKVIGNNTGTAPGSGWNGNPGFNDSGWAAATVLNPETLAGVVPVGWLWDSTGGTGTPNRYVWFRKTFTLSDVPAGGALFFSAVDDDAVVYINDVPVINNSDCTASELPVIDVAGLLVKGTNLIAVAAHDCGGAQGFDALLFEPQPIPALDYRGLFVLAGLLAVVGVLVIRRSA